MFLTATALVLANFILNVHMLVHIDEMDPPLWVRRWTMVTSQWKTKAFYFQPYESDTPMANVLNNFLEARADRQTRINVSFIFCQALSLAKKTKESMAEDLLEY